MARIESQAKGGYYPTPDGVVRMIAECLDMTYIRRSDQNTSEHRILDPCCGTGKALQELGQSMAQRSILPVRTYGVEVNGGRAEAAARSLDEVIEGDLMQVSIGHKSFGMVYLNPPYDLEADGTGKRIETAFLQKCTPYLDDGGAMVLVIPVGSVSHVAKHMGTWYHSLKLWPFPRDEYAAYKQVIVIGRKRRTATGYNREAEDLEYKADRLSIGVVPPVEEIKIQVGHAKTGKVQFQPMFFDHHQVAREAREKGLWTSARLHDALWPGDDPDAKPLLPLRQGHLAILSAAGFLNNRVLTGEDGSRVLVKGRSYKEMVDVEETKDKTVSREFQRTTVTKLDLETGEFHRVKT